MILVASRELLGSDDVVEASDADDDATDLLIGAAVPQRMERNISAVAVAKFSKHVDRTGIGHPGGTPERTQGLGVELNRELAGLVVGHPADTQSRSELAERFCEPSQVGQSAFGYTVDVVRRTESAVRSGTQSADEDVLDVVFVEGLKDSPGVERLLSHSAPPQLVGR